MKGKIIKLIVLTWILLTVFGKNKLMAEEIDPQIQKGIEYYKQARNPGENNIDQLIEECLKSLHPFTQENAYACAIYGSALTLKAGILAEDSPIKSLSFLEEGNTYLDKAVTMQPDYEILRLIRLENGIEVSRSSPVKRYSEVSDDVAFFIDDEKVERFSDETKAEVYLYCGFYYLDSGDLDYALELFEMAQEASPDTYSGERAQKMLDRYSE